MLDCVIVVSQACCVAFSHGKFITSLVVWLKSVGSHAGLSLSTAFHGVQGESHSETCFENMERVVQKPDALKVIAPEDVKVVAKRRSGRYKPQSQGGPVRASGRRTTTQHAVATRIQQLEFNKEMGWLLGWARVKKKNSTDEPGAGSPEGLLHGGLSMKVENPPDACNAESPVGVLHCGNPVKVEESPSACPAKAILLGRAVRGGSRGYTIINVVCEEVPQEGHHGSCGQNHKPTEETAQSTRQNPEHQHERRAEHHGRRWCVSILLCRKR